MKNCKPFTYQVFINIYICKRKTLPSLYSSLVTEIKIFPTLPTQRIEMFSEDGQTCFKHYLWPLHWIVSTVFLQAHARLSQSLLLWVCKTRPSALGVLRWPSDTAAQACRRMRPMTRHCMLKSQWVWLFLLHKASWCQMGCNQWPSWALPTLFSFWLLSIGDKTVAAARDGN